ncbi:MAG TPA: hypothetical protein PLK94_11685 [Alphaproteobacteria bacterium]|nr:hypothetical protein [Alphaproteobacteria bacterium]
MSKKVPDDIAKEIKERVFLEADRVNYLARSRTDNGNFLAKLVAMPNVGGRLSQYMKKAEVRTYIKDAILNRYSKDKTQEERPDVLGPIIKEKLGIDAYLVEQETKSQISLFNSPSNSYFVVVADGTVLKWETALRKALLYVASKPFSEQIDVSIKILLTLFARHQKVSPSDLRHIEKALSMCNAKPYIYGEG